MPRCFSACSNQASLLRRTNDALAADVGVQPDVGDEPSFFLSR